MIYKENGKGLRVSHHKYDWGIDAYAAVSYGRNRNE